MTKTFKECPSVEIPEFLSGPEWLDESYGNDVTGHVRRDLPKDCPYELWVWVHPEDKTKRESDEYTRFGVVIYDASTGDEIDGSNCETVEDCQNDIEVFMERINLLINNSANNAQ